MNYLPVFASTSVSIVLPVMNGGLLISSAHPCASNKYVEIQNHTHEEVKYGGKSLASQKKLYTI